MKIIRTLRKCWIYWENAGDLLKCSSSLLWTAFNCLYCLVVLNRAQRLFLCEWYDCCPGPTSKQIIINEITTLENCNFYKISYSLLIGILRHVVDRNRGFCPQPTMWKYINNNTLNLFRYNSSIKTSLTMSTRNDIGYFDCVALSSVNKLCSFFPRVFITQADCIFCLSARNQAILRAIIIIQKNDFYFYLVRFSRWN